MSDKNQLSTSQVTNPTLAICLVSGGMDSLVAAACAQAQQQKLAFLHLNYGQKTQSKELECFNKIADHYQIASNLRKIIDVQFLKQIGGSSLTDDKIQVSDYQGDSNDIPSSYVPFRNTHLISMAVSWAEVIGANKIYVGAVYEDSSGYPDCRPSYYQAFNKLIQEGTKAKSIKIETPIIFLNKPQIIQKAYELNAPLEHTWSCYANQDRACGVCDSCALRLRAFQKLGLEDPICYVKRPHYL